MAANVKPLGNRVLIKPLEEEQKKGGIIIPDTAKEKSERGEVKAVGIGKLLDNGQRVAPEVKVGDKVLFGKYGGTEIKLDGEDYTVLDADDVLGIVS